MRSTQPKVLLALRIVCPIILIACTVVTLQVLHLNDFGPRLAHLSGAFILLTFLVYVYTGLRVNDPESLSKIRQTVRAHILDSVRWLSILSVLLLIVLGAVTWVGTSSEPVEFVTQSNVGVKVRELRGEESRIWGTASGNKPLRIRLASGYTALSSPQKGTSALLRTLQ